MEYNYKLLQAEVTDVYNNLIIDARLASGEVTAAFCGAAEIADLCTAGTPVWLKRTSKNKRLVKYNVAFVKTPEGMIFTNPKYNRQLFAEAFKNRAIADLAAYTVCRPLNSSGGIDFELTAPDGKKCFVFVTSVYDKQNGQAVFPNAINFFEIKVMEKMRRLKAAGCEVCIFMIVPREDCLSARFVWNLDPNAAAVLFDAAKSGINFLCYGCKTAKNRVEINRKMEILY